MADEVNSGLSADEYDGMDSGIGRPVAGNYKAEVGAVEDYSAKSYRIPFTLLGGTYGGFTGFLYSVKEPVKTEGGKIFWPFKNWASACGVEPDRSSGSVKFTKKQLDAFHGKKCLVVFKDKPYHFEAESGEVYDGVTPKADHLKPLPDKKTEDIAL